MESYLSHGPNHFVTAPSMIKVNEMETLRTTTWISPGWLLTSSYVSPDGVDSSRIKLWNTGCDSTAWQLSTPAAELHLTTIPGSVFGMNVTKDVTTENAYLVIAYPWT